MTIKNLLLIILTISTLTSCKRGYKVEGDKVYYEYWNEGSGQNKLLIEEADARTFQKLTFDCDCNYKFGKDQNHLFIDGKIIKNIDPNTFEFIGNYIFRDKDAAYFLGFYNDINDCIIKGVDPDKITLIQYPWAKADKLLIYGQDTVYLNDIDDFRPIDKQWGKTKKYIINQDKIIYGADIKTFKIIDAYHGKDKNYNYRLGFIAKEDFEKTKYENFDKQAICNSKLIEFTDIYGNEEELPDYQFEKSVIVEDLKLNGFKIEAVRFDDWSSGPRIVSYSLTNQKCYCYVDKVYHYDYSKPSETEKEYRITERIRCESSGR